MKNFTKNISKATTALCLLAIGVVISMATVPVQAKVVQGVDIKVATYNILGQEHRGNIGVRSEAASKVIRQNDLDVFGVQEMGVAQYGLFKKHLGSDYGQTSKPSTLRQANNTVFWKKALFDKQSEGVVHFPTYGSKGLDPSVGYARWVKLKVRTTGQTFYFLNIHLASWNKDPGSDKQGAQKRERGARLVHDWLTKVNKSDPNSAIFVVGDMNSRGSIRPGRENVYKGDRSRLPYCIFTEDGILRHAIDARANRRKHCPTREIGGPDHIFVSSGVKVNTYGLIVRKGPAAVASDHAAVMSKVTLTGAKTPEPSNPQPSITQKKCNSMHRVWRDGKCTSICAKGYEKSSDKPKTCVKSKKQQKDTEKPTVELLLPTDGKVYSKKLTFSANAKDNVGVEKVEFYANERRIVTDRVEKYQKNWDISQVSNGAYSVYAVAVDTSGNKQKSKIVSVVVDNQKKSTSNSAKQKVELSNGRSMFVELEGSCYKGLKAQPYEISSALPDGVKAVYAVDFSVGCALSGGKSEVILKSMDELDEDSFRLFKIENQEYKDITNVATLTSEDEDGVKIFSIHYEIADGGDLDQDASENSSVTDPVLVGFVDAQSNVGVNGQPATKAGAGKGADFLPNTGTSATIAGIAIFGGLASVWLAKRIKSSRKHQN